MARAVYDPVTKQSCRILRPNARDGVAPEITIFWRDRCLPTAETLHLLRA